MMFAKLLPKSKMKFSIFLMVLFSYFNMSGQNYKLDSLKIFYVLNNDSTFDFKNVSTFTGPFKQVRRQFYSSMEVKKNLKFEANNKKRFFADTILKSIINDYPLIDGEYYQGKKIGKWTYWYDYGSQYSFCTLMFPEYNIEYKTDSIIYKLLFPTRQRRIAYNNDSTLTVGFTVYDEDMRINFKCENKKECYYWYKNEKNIVIWSKFEDLLVTLTLFEKGEFNREINNFR